MTAPLLRVARPEEVALMADWAAAEGWNPGLDDAAAFHASDPEGFFVAEIGGEAVASISVVNHDARFAFLGFYICRPDWRGRGIGRALWDHALDHAGGRTIGLDGVADQEANYAKSGFVRRGASVRHEGLLAPAGDPAVRPIGPQDGSAVQRLDQQANGFARPGFLAGWTRDGATRRTLVLERAGAVIGFATIRRCQVGAKLGPVVAPTPDDALVLAHAALAVMPVEKLIVDVPSDNTGLTALLVDAGFTASFATARMYRGTAPHSAPSLQAIATMELG